MQFPRTAALAFLGVSCTLAAAQTTVRRMTVFPLGNSVQVEINASGPVTPQAQVVTNPDRIVMDFPNSLPGNDLHNLSINRGQIRGLRVGLFSENPPVTRVVVDLDAPQPYQIFPSGSTIVLKLNSAGNPVASIPAAQSTPAPAAAQPAPSVATAVASPTPPLPTPRMSVDFRNGSLKIFSDRASLAEVLTEVRRRTGADIPIPPSAAQEQVFGTFGPGAARDVMAALLNGTQFNFVMAGTETDPSQLRSVILSPRDGSPVSVPAIETPEPSGIVQVPPDPNEAATEPTEAPPLDENPNPPDQAADQPADPAAGDADSNAQAEPDMSPRRHRRRGAAEPADPPQ
jgi:hypothetical protein